MWKYFVTDHLFVWVSMIILFLYKEPSACTTFVQHLKLIPMQCRVRRVIVGWISDKNGWQHWAIVTCRFERVCNVDRDIPPLEFNQFLWNPKNLLVINVWGSSARTEAAETAENAKNTILAILTDSTIYILTLYDRNIIHYLIGNYETDANTQMPNLKILKTTNCVAIIPI